VEELADSAALVSDPDGLADPAFRVRRPGHADELGPADRHPGPAPAEFILGPRGRPPELFSRLFSRERWWEPVPAGLVLEPRAELAGVPPGPSRLVAVHPGWQHWRPPPAAVH
jgi:hypothetical protein